MPENKVAPAVSQLAGEMKEDSLKGLARLLDRQHMFVPKLKGDPKCHYCSNVYEHEVHWRDGECSWSAKYRIISAALSEREEKVKTLREYSADLVRVIRRGDCGDFSPIMDEIFDVEAALSSLGESK